MLGAMMFCSKLVMELLPNIHLLGMFTVLFAAVFRVKGLIPIYICVLLTGIYAGFSLWWVPYLYLWLILWGVTMLLPKRMPRAVKAVAYPLVCSLHGLLYGTLYAPLQALMFGLDFDAMIAWIIVGLPWDITHAVGNFVAGLLVLPLSELLRKVLKIKQ